jgi:hypothetical protein
LGYSYRIIPLTLPYLSPSFAPHLDHMRTQMRKRLPHVLLTNRAARREFYVSPLLFAALDQVGFKMSIEYPVTGTRLRGAMDYLLRGAHNVVAIEAKNGEMVRGFTQLAAQMVAQPDLRRDHDRGSVAVWSAGEGGENHRKGHRGVPVAA